MVVCLVCEELVTRDRRATTCSDDCRKILKRQRSRERMRRLRKDPETYAVLLEWAADSYDKNREKYNEAARSRYAENPTPKRMRARNWHISNLDRSRENNRRWCKENPDYIRARNLTRRARDPIDPAVVQSVFATCNYQCVYCDATKRLTIDHLLPVIRGGKNNEDNLVVACLTCNTSKGAKMPLDFIWYRERCK